MPENVRNEFLIKLKIYDEDTSKRGGIVLYPDFYNLRENSRNELLMALVDMKIATLQVVSWVASNFDKLPENVQNLLFKLAENKETAYIVAYVVAGEFDKLSPNVQNLLFKLADDKDLEIASYVADVVASNFDKLPENVQNLLFKLAENKETAYIVAYVVAQYFYKLREDVQTLLFKVLDDNKGEAKEIVKAIIDTVDKLPESTRNELQKRFI